MLSGQVHSINNCNYKALHRKRLINFFKNVSDYEDIGLFDKIKKSVGEQ